MSKESEELALKIVQHAFKDKKDLAGESYLYHLYAVRNAFKTDDTELRTIALLHDLLEDCPEWNEDVLNCFFQKWIVSALVALKKEKGENYEDYLERVKANSSATKVKIADLKDNMDITRLNDLTEKDFVRLKKYKKAYEFLKN